LVPGRIFQASAQEGGEQAGRRTRGEDILPAGAVREDLADRRRDGIHSEVRRAEQTECLRHAIARRDVGGHGAGGVEAHHHPDAPAHLSEVEQGSFVIDEEINHAGQCEHEVAKREPRPAAVAIDQPSDERSDGDRGETFDRDRTPDSRSVHAELGGEELG
jgi:hypothetical protein